MGGEGKLSGCEGGDDVWGEREMGKLSGCEGGEDVWGERGMGNCLGLRVGKMCESSSTLLEMTHV